MKKPVTIHYRKCEGVEGITGNLESALRRGFATQITPKHTLFSRYKLRIRNVNGESVFANLLFDKIDSNNIPYLFGDLVCFTKGQLQPILDDSADDAPSANVEQLKAPAKKEYLHSQMYWFVRDDHVFAIQSSSLRAEALEDYFSWLLTQRTSIRKSDYRVVLSARFDPDAVGGDLSDIQEVVIGGSVARLDDKQEDIVKEVDDVRTIEQHEKTEKGRLREILDMLMENSANVDKILKSIPEDTELSVRVHIGYKTKKRKVSRQALHDLEVGLRNVPDSQLSVKGKDGCKNTDGTVRLQHKAAINLIPVPEGDRPGALLEPTDVLRAMLEAYTVFLANGKIKD